jgi:elongation factor 1-beta
MPVLKAALGHEIVTADKFSAGVKDIKAVCKVLNDHLKNKHFLVGDNLTIADVVVSCALIVAFQTVLDAGFRKGFSAVSEWFEKCMGLPSFVRRLGYIKMTEKPMKQFDPNAKPAPVSSAAAPAKKAEKVDDDMDDLFGDDSDDGAAAAAAAKAKAAKNKKVKAPVIAQSLIMFEIKPLDSDTDLDAVAKRVLAIRGPAEGVYWKTEYKKVPVAFGIFKLIMGVTVEDEKVSVDGLQEEIEAFEDMVQSVDIMAFNKI